MSDTKENILQTALRLFARDGYEAVSVSDIAGELGMTKGALYRHYRSKRDIFDSIVERMYRIDAERSQEFCVPENADGSFSAGGAAAWESIRRFTAAQFVFWTEDAFARDFRRMLTLEQYRDDEMAELYRSCLTAGPVEYMTGVFGNMAAAGLLRDGGAKLLALEYCAPLFLLIQMSDRTADRADCAALLDAHIRQFTRCHAAGAETGNL